VGEPVVGTAGEVSILEDEPMLARLAADLCGELGVSATTFDSPAACLNAAHESPPRVLILDWRLRDQLGAAAFLAVRHRYPMLPVVCWTASQPLQLPQMIRDDPTTRLVDKAAGVEQFEAALRWALAFADQEGDPQDVRPVSHSA
jgi:DNA-binding NtrC family response regulator